MIQTCSKCSRANPGDAQYCYYDGFVLAGGGGRNGGPVAVGSQPFSSPFVFPSGRACRNFNELALACQEEWDSAKDMLQQGYLGTFLGGLGRMDLVMAAKEAAKFPDADRGLDQLLSKLPSDSLMPATLKVETQEINLGTLHIGDQRKFELHLENQGMGLVHGSITCADGVWLSFGEGPGTTEKHFQFRSEMTLPVHVVGDRLRAGNKPLEAKLLLDTSGGAATVIVRAEVPVKPFPPGVLGGAKSPRQVAEKAKANAKEAAPLFEKGEVRNWYKSNGWTYPVQGPDASGLGALQQFFEALGLTPAPKVDIDNKSFSLKGKPGDSLSFTVKVETPEKKPVYAHGISDEPWMEVGRPVLAGRTATIRVGIPSVPDKPGETLEAKLTVRANGNQSFVVPVTLKVAGTPRAAAVMPVEPVPEVVEAVEPVVEVAENPFVTPAPAPAVQEQGPSSLADLEPSAPRTSTGRRRRDEGGTFKHALAAIALALAVLIVVLIDLFTSKPTEAGQGGEPQQQGSPAGEMDLTYKPPKETAPYLSLGFNQDDRFGLVLTKVPDEKNPLQKKRLSFFEQGDSNNTIVRIDGFEHYFGAKTRENLIKSRKNLKPPRLGRITVMDFTNHSVEVTQHVEIVPGTSELLDTCLIYYTIKNYGKLDHTIGLRVMFDTFIGSNDGVPITVPGEKGFVTTKRAFDQKNMPPYIEVIEHPENPRDLGTVARMGLRGIRFPGVQLEDPEKVLICRWPGNKQARWNAEFQDMQDDSCVFLYWQERLMHENEERRMAFTYGLGEVALTGLASGGGSVGLGLSNPGVVAPNTEFPLTAYVYGAKKGDKVRLHLPDSGISLAPGEELEKVIDEDAPQGKPVSVPWKLKAGDAGQYEIEASSGKARTKPLKITVRATSIFG
jgi:hypothetical protein